MGSLRMFRCEGCGYEAEISGGLDFGMASATWTVHCLDCCELQDVVVSDEPWKVSEEGWTPDTYACDRDPKHKVSLWSDPGPCPKCGKGLTAGEPTVLWD